MPLHCGWFTVNASSGFHAERLEQSTLLWVHCMAWIHRGLEKVNEELTVKCRRSQKEDSKSSWALLVSYGLPRRYDSMANCALSSTDTTRITGGAILSRSLLQSPTATTEPGNTEGEGTTAWPAYSVQALSPSKIAQNYRLRGHSLWTVGTLLRWKLSCSVGSKGGYTRIIS
ncbi:uncharacterized protein BP01DRAFT_366621 [Aspergillus saccharolyticus JOP 1030-1]|uniref:Uncharacterized protein n=1 Tax=Aspergillus saccharolyticus JOP 1030-1 TaxID=1450539 RepID=A0A318ZAW4_9EURO|nr:hypothetical protein BP01DRAFT_366621 [Aspergillus saccharolyticus JOP 1030-1]PYH44496.1 hypothetical protein BP01DRAFT_366621 [Aspergillus saccharolyticus JOP 1030-1]